MCLGHVRYSVRVSHHPCYIVITFMCYPISCNCLAPPHFPESPHRTFIPQCVYIVHTLRSVFAMFFNPVYFNSVYSLLQFPAYLL